jgi:hypothetical protein
MVSPISRVTGLLGCALVTAFLLSSCASTTSGSAASSPLPDGLPPVVAGAAHLDSEHEDVTMPLARYQLTAEQYGLLRQASNRLVEECVERSGYDIQLPPPADPYLSVTHYSFGVWTEQRAAAFGYGLAPHPPEAEALEVELATGDGARLAAVQSCLSSAESRALNDGMDSDGIASRGDSDSWFSMDSDPRAATIVEAHRACMAGHDVQIGDDWAVEGIESMSAEQKIQTALLDVACKRDSHFVQGLADIAAAYQESFIARNASQLAEEKHQLDALLVRAREILGEEG